MMIEKLSASLSRLKGVREGRSRFGSPRAWSVAGREFAHLHAPHLVDLRLPRSIQARLRSDPRARFRKSASDWVEFEFRTAADVADMVALARQAWSAARNPRRRNHEH